MITSKQIDTDTLQALVSMNFNNDSRVRRGVKEEEDEGENGDEDAEPHEEEKPLPLTDQRRKQKDENAENDQKHFALPIHGIGLAICKISFAFSLRKGCVLKMFRSCNMMTPHCKPQVPVLFLINDVSALLTQSAEHTKGFLRRRDIVTKSRSS